jgi:hypothetical protein
LDLVNHKFGDQRGGVVNNVGDLDGVIFSQRDEEIPVASISSVKFIFVKINACQCKSTLKVPLVVGGVVCEIECVCGIIAKGSRFSDTEAQHRVE